MPNNEKLESDLDLFMLIGQIQKLSTKRFVQNSHNYKLDISLDQWIVLGPVWKNEGISQKNIADYRPITKT